MRFDESAFSDEYEETDRTPEEFFHVGLIAVTGQVASAWTHCTLDDGDV